MDRQTGKKKTGRQANKQTDKQKKAEAERKKAAATLEAAIVSAHPPKV